MLVGGKVQDRLFVDHLRAQNRHGHIYMGFATKMMANLTVFPSLSKSIQIAPISFLFLLTTGAWVSSVFYGKDKIVATDLSCGHDFANSREFFLVIRGKSF